MYLPGIGWLKGVMWAPLRHLTLGLLRICSSFPGVNWAKRKFPRVQSIIAQWKMSQELFVQLRKHNPDTYQILMSNDLPERLHAIIAARVVTDGGWQARPASSAPRSVSVDVLFVSYAAHPDLVKQCIALKRERPGIRCALAVQCFAHTERLSQQWFDEVRIVGRGNKAELMGILRRADAKVVILRYLDVVFNTCARLSRQGPLIYSPPGFFLSSRSEDYLSDPGLTFDAVFEAEKFLLERVDGVIHFLSDPVIEWFKTNGVNIACPTATVYVACMPELDPPTKLPKLSEKDGEWHIVHATGVPKATNHPKWGGDTFLALAKCEEVIKQGIHLHVYGTYFDRNRPEYAAYVELERRSPYFHIEDQLEFDDLITTMTQYDYAWKHWDVSRKAIWPIHKGVTPNFYAYIQSGLPLLLSPMAYALEVELAREHGIGLIVGEGELGNLRQILDDNKQNLAEMQKRVERGKSGVFSYDTQSLLKVIGPYLTN